MIGTAIRAALVADATLVAMVESYRSQPAVFVDGEVPFDFQRGTKPYVVVAGGEAGPYLDGDQATFTSSADLLVLGSSDGDASDVHDAAVRARLVLRDAALAVAGHSFGGATVQGPTTDDPDDLTYGRRLAVAALLNAT